MSDLNLIRQQMVRISHSLDDPELMLGRPNDDHKAEELAQRLERLHDETQDILERQIRKVAKSLRSEEQRLKSIPHDNRWSAKQRVAQLNAELKWLQKEAESLAKKVLDLLDKNGLLNVMQTGRALGELAEAAEKVLGHGVRVQMQQALLQAPVIMPIETISADQLDKTVPFVVLAVYGMKRLIGLWSPSVISRKA